MQFIRQLQDMFTSIFFILNTELLSYFRYIFYFKKLIHETERTNFIIKNKKKTRNINGKFVQKVNDTKYYASKLLVYFAFLLVKDLC